MRRRSRICYWIRTGLEEVQKGFRKMKGKHFAYLFIIGVIAIKAWQVAFRTADTALWQNDYAIDGVTNPEGLLWAILNPIQLGERGYQLWCFGFDMLMLGIQLKIARIPKVYLGFSQIFSMYVYVGWGHTIQNVTIVALCPFILLSSWYAILPLIQKLPVWFDWQNLKTHVMCALYCTPVHGLGNFSTYAAIGFCFVAPFIVKRNLPFWHRADEVKLL